MCAPYGKLTGEVFSGLVDKHFPAAAYHHSKLFLQDNCPAQNARVAREAQRIAASRLLRELSMVYKGEEF